MKREDYKFPLPFDETVGLDVFKDVEKKPVVSDVDSEYKEKHCYMKNILIRDANLDFPYTPEQIAEIKKCKYDIFYFIENYCEINTLDSGVQLFEPHQYQKNMIKLMNDERFTIHMLPRQSGKCTVKDTMVTVRDTVTGEVSKVTVETFHSMMQS